MIQTILDVDLADYRTSSHPFYDFAEFDRQMRHQLAHLTTGSCVRLNVHKCQPIEGYTSWAREDLVIQVSTKDAVMGTLWKNALQESQATRKGARR